MLPRVGENSSSTPKANPMGTNQLMRKGTDLRLFINGFLIFFSFVHRCWDSRDRKVRKLQTGVTLFSLRD